MPNNLQFYADLDEKEFYVVDHKETIAFGNFELERNKFNYKIFNPDYLENKFYNYVTNQMEDLWAQVR